MNPDILKGELEINTKTVGIRSRFSRYNSDYSPPLLNKTCCMAFETRRRRGATVEAVTAWAHRDWATAIHRPADNSSRVIRRETQSQGRLEALAAKGKEGNAVGQREDQKSGSCRKRGGRDCASKRAQQLL